MKHYLPLLFLTFLFSKSFTAQAQDFDNPSTYMSYLGQQQESISKKFMSYASASAHGKKAKKVDNLRTKLLDEVQDARMNISGMPSFKGDKSYRDTTVNFMKLYYNVLNDDYSKIVNMEDIAEQSYDEMEAYLLLKEAVDKKLEEGNNKMKTAQQKFAAEHNITLTNNSSDLDNMVNEVADLNKYYNDVYLVFFKPYVQEKYLMEATGKANITAIEQDKNSMQKYAQEGLTKLATMKGYKGDNSVLAECKNILNFYNKEADMMSVVTDYLLKTERFKTIQKEFEKKSDASKQEVSDYNKAVDDVNKATKLYNNNNKNLNDMRSDAFNSWNKSVNSFFNDHTPHYK